MGVHQIGDVIVPEKYNEVFPPEEQAHLKECLDDILTGRVRQGRIELTISEGKVIRTFLGKHFDK